jgi:hypothetical protein
MDGVDGPLPGLRLRIHNSRMAIENYSPSYVDTSLEGALSTSLPGMPIPLNPVVY